MSFSELVLNTEYRSSIALTSRDFYAPILKVAISMIEPWASFLHLR